LQGKWDNFTDALQGAMAATGESILESLSVPLEKVTKDLESANGTFAKFGKGAAEVIDRVMEEKEDPGFLEYIHAAGVLVSSYIPILDRQVKAEQALADQMRENEMIEKVQIQVLEKQAEAQKVAAKQLSDYNSYLDVYMAKQSRANAETEAATAAVKKQAEEIKKLQDDLSKAESQTSLIIAGPKQKQKEEGKKLTKINDQINWAAFKGDEAEMNRLKIEREGIIQRIVLLEREIQAETQKQVEANSDLSKSADEKMMAAAKETEERDKAMQLFALELAIAEAASRGQDAKVAKLERERDIIETTARLVRELGLGYAEAAQMAERLVNAETKAEQRGKGEDGKRSKIYGYSRDRQGEGGDAFTRATAARDAATSSANTRFIVGTGLQGGRFDEFGEGQKQRFNRAFGNAPAEQASPRSPESGLSQVMNTLEAWAAKTTETFERAFQ
jgi:hypothetical protein